MKNIKLDLDFEQGHMLRVAINTTIGVCKSQLKENKKHKDCFGYDKIFGDRNNLLEKDIASYEKLLSQLNNI